MVLVVATVVAVGGSCSGGGGCSCRGSCVDCVLVNMLLINLSNPTAGRSKVHVSNKMGRQV